MNLWLKTQRREDDFSFGVWKSLLSLVCPKVESHKQTPAGSFALQTYLFSNLFIHIKLNIWSFLHNSTFYPWNENIKGYRVKIHFLCQEGLHWFDFLYSLERVFFWVIQVYDLDVTGPQVICLFVQLPKGALGNAWVGLSCLANPF